jgi:acetoin utilization protein AcuB
MIARNLISNAIPPLKLSDDGTKALAWMNNFHLQHLPVIDNLKYVGVIGEYDIIDSNDAEKLLGERDFSNNHYFVYDHVHIYEVIKVLNKNKLSLIAVLDRNDTYLGVITVSDLLEFLASANSMQDPGGIIVLEMNVRNYVLSEIANIVESNGAKILSLYVSIDPSGLNLETTIKINKTLNSFTLCTLSLRRIVYQLTKSP